MAKLGMLSNRIATMDSRRVKPPPKERAPKTADPFYLTPAFRQWRETIVARAGRRCEHISSKTGKRCPRAEPEHRMFADHVIERKDGGADYDPNNGQCLCGGHHVAKTHKARQRREEARAEAGKRVG